MPARGPDISRRESSLFVASTPARHLPNTWPGERSALRGVYLFFARARARDGARWTVAAQLAVHAKRGLYVERTEPGKFQLKRRALLAIPGSTIARRSRLGCNERVRSSPRQRSCCR